MMRFIMLIQFNPYYN